MTRHAVCAVDDLEHGESETVTVDGVSVGVFNIEGEYHALLNACRHQGGPVCEGDVSRAIQAEFVGPGRDVEEAFTDDYVVTCPWHGWSYDVRTGEHVGDADIQLPTYDVIVEDDVVYLAP